MTQHSQYYQYYTILPISHNITNQVFTNITQYYISNITQYSICGIMVFSINITQYFQYYSILLIQYYSILPTFKAVLFQLNMYQYSSTLQATSNFHQYYLILFEHLADVLGAIGSLGHWHRDCPEIRSEREARSPQNWGPAGV